MCGIAGIRYFDDRPVDPARLRAMSQALAHRGPDGVGERYAPGIGLAHRRLAIISPGPSGQQPMALADDSLAITFNGEIHNHVELRAELARAGHAFRTRTDTEVILAAYRAWGTAGFDRFNGPWAFALWDARRHELLLCRDRFGQRPLFWSRRGGRIAFASETRALLRGFPEERERDELTVQRYLAGSAPHRDAQSFLANVRQVEPAQVLSFGPRGHERIHRYWKFEPGPVEARADDAERVRALLEDAVRLRLRSDAPLGALLSGGLDSGAIVRLAGRGSGRALPCFSLRYPTDIDESALAALTAADEPAHPIRWVEPDAEDLFERVRRIVCHGDGPLPMRGKVGLWSLHEAAARELKVTLEGSGADEIFAGYAAKCQLPFVLDHLARHRYAIHRRAVRHDLLGDHGARGLRGRTLYNRTRKFARAVLLGRTDRSLDGIISPGYVSRAVVRECNRSRHAWFHAHAPSPFEARLDTALWEELAHGELRESLHAHDMLAMAHGVETRAPFLDHRLVELAFTLPAECKIRNLRTKAILRESLADVMPRVILEERSKQGLPAPWDLWSRDATFVAGTRELLDDPRTRARPWYDRAGYAQLLDGIEHRAGPYSGDSEALWRLLSLEHWCRDFIEGDPSGYAT